MWSRNLFVLGSSYFVISLMTIPLWNQCTIGTKLYPFDKLHSVAEEVEKVQAVNEDDKNCLRDALKKIKRLF